jgi:tetratricopeptide (TPR) repeat protein
VALSLTNLARVNGEQGNYAASIQLQMRALKIWEKFYGPKHPKVAIALNNIAMDYSRAGKPAAAEPFMRRALSLWESELGAGASHGRYGTRQSGRCVTRVAKI